MSFDVVWAIESVCHTENKKDFIKEASRLLKSGGVLVVSDFFLEDKQYSNEQHDRMKVWLDGWAVPNLAINTNFANILQKHGFEDIDYENATQKVMKFSKWLSNRSNNYYRVGELLRVASLRGETEQGNVRAVIAQYPCLADGLWQYGIFTARKR